MPIVSLPNGTELDFPDGMSEDAMRNAIVSNFPEYAPKQETSILDRAKDVGISALKGAISVPEAIVGLADIPTLGYAGKAAEAVGFRPKEAKAILESGYSDTQQAANKRVSDAKGFTGTVAAAIENPSVIAHNIVESVPSMLAGGVAGRAVVSTTGAAPWVAGAVGEGVIGAGSAAENIRQNAADGTLSPGQAAAAVGSGLGTAAFGAAGGRVAQKLGIADVDTLLAGGAAKLTSQGVARRIITGGISEGAFEELPQSAQEQVWQNAALGKPLLDGVPEAAGMGFITGAAMGGLSGGAVKGRRVTGPTPSVVDIGAATSIDEAISAAASVIDSAGKNGKETDADLRPEFEASLVSSEPAQLPATDAASTSVAAPSTTLTDTAISLPPVAATGELVQVPNQADASAAVNLETAPAALWVARPSIEGRQIDAEWSEFHPDSGTLGIPREQMPQIRAEHRGAMVNFLNARGIDHEQLEVPAGSLKPTQQEFSRAKVAKAKEFEGGDRSILVSADGHVLDGHHQWAARLENNEPVKVIRLDAPIKDLLKQVKEFPSAEVSRRSDAAEAKTLRETRTRESVLADESAPSTFTSETIGGNQPQGENSIAANMQENEGSTPPGSRYPVPADASGASGFAGESPNAGGIAPTVRALSGKESITAEDADPFNALQLSRADVPHTVQEKDFVIAPTGGTDFGEITSAQAAAMRRQAGKIRLVKGVQNADGTGYGLAHIEANHGTQIRKAGFSSVEEFVSHVAAKFDEISQVPGRQLLLAVNEGRRDVMYIQLEPAADGDYYRINTAFPVRRDYAEKQKKKGGLKVLWDGREPTSTIPGQQPLYADNSDSSSGQNAPNAQGQSKSSVAPDENAGKPVEPDDAQFFKQDPNYKLPEPFRTKSHANLFKAKNRLTAVAEEADGGWALQVEPRDLSEREKLEAMRDVTRLNNALAANGVAQVKPVYRAPSREYQLAMEVAKVFGIKVQFVSNNGTFDGVAHRGVAYLAEGMKRPALAIAGHEALHVMQQTNPELAKDLYRHIQQHLHEDAVPERKLREELMSGGPVSEDYALGEVVADLSGSMWMLPKFWRDMRAKDENLFRKTAYLFLEAMTKAIDSLTGTRFDAKSLVKDVDAVRKLISDAWAEHNKQRDNTQNGQQENTVESSGAPAKAAAEAAGSTDAAAGRGLAQGREGVDENSAGQGQEEIADSTPAFSRVAGDETNQPNVNWTDEAVKERRSSYLGELNAAQEQAARNIGVIAPEKTLKDRLAEVRSSLAKNFVQGVADQFAPLRALDAKAYLLARMSKASDGALEALMLYGKPFIRDGVMDVRLGEGGFGKVLSDLDGEHDRFFLWVAAQRAELLKMKGKENLFTDSDISALKTLNRSDPRHPTRQSKFAAALDKLNEFNDTVLGAAVESGILSEEARQLFKYQPYVPFYRTMEDEGSTGPSFSSGLINQYAFKKLKGGTNQLNQDLLANVLLNWSHLYAAAAKNRAASKAMEAAVRVGVAQPVPSGTKGSVKVLEGGQYKHYEVEDPHLFEAISALEHATPKWFKPFSTVKRWLTIGVTASPTFKIRNLIRDSVSAVAQGELSYNPVKNVVQGFKATGKDSQTYASMIASGGVIRLGTMYEGDRAEYAHRLIASGVDKNTILDASGIERLQGMLRNLWEAYNEVGDRFENVNRTALYEQMIDRGYSHDEASFAARDLLDFSMSGKWPVIRFLTQSVPFLNARIQGLYKLGRAGTENPKRMGYVVGAVSLASLALLWGYSDDDDWKKREDWDRDNFWWFKIGGVAFRIPKPFEIGAIGTIVERTWEKFTDNEMTWKRYGTRLSDMAFHTFSFNPVPQLVKPLLDVYANKDGFTGRPIETMGMERLKPEDRYTERTSTVAKFFGSLGLPDPGQLAMGRFKELSPVQIDSLLRGYFGWLGTATTTVLDYGLRRFQDRGERPERQLKETFVIGNFVETLPSGSSRYVTAMYEDSKAIEEAYNSYKNAIKTGDKAKALEIRETEREKLKRYESTIAIRRRIGEINGQIKKIESSKTISGRLKREMIDNLQQKENELAKKLAQSPGG